MYNLCMKTLHIIKYAGVYRESLSPVYALSYANFSLSLM